MIPRFGAPPRADQRYKLRPGVYAILPLGDQILATWQGGIHDEVQLPGGGIDPGESPLQALHREVYEETGWTIASPRRIGAHRRFTYMPEYDQWAEKLCTIYIARPVRALSEPPEPDHDALWLDIVDAVGLLAIEGDAVMLARAIRAGLV